MTKYYNIYDRKSFPAGRTIIHNNDLPLNAYLIQSGTAEVFRETANGRTLVAKLEPGDIIGDMAIIRGTKHQSTVVASENLVVVVIPPEHLKKSIETAPPLVKTLLNGLIQKLDRASKEKEI